MNPEGLDSLDAKRRDWVSAAWQRVSADRLRELITNLTGIASPTGDEGPLARHIADELTASGVEARVQPMDDRQANVYGRLRAHGRGAGTGMRPAAGDGADLMLYAPIDTLTVGSPSADVPWAGPELRDDMRPEARVVGPYVTGLGASNPKGHAACVLAATEAIAATVAAGELPLAGDLLAGFGAGGMPTNALRLCGDPRQHTGQGAGCSFLLEQGFWADWALIAKPGWTVSWEEVGLAWFEVTVHGTHTYVGSRHKLPYRNAIADAGEVAERLERWFPEYAERHTDGLVAPQGVVSAIEGGWMRMASVTPAACRLRVDLRLSPRTTPMGAKREFAAAVDKIRADLPEADIDWDMVLAIPGTSTDPDAWVCRTAVAAWEAIEGRQHEPATGMSGATDANILRNRGIPTARIGMPKVADTTLPVDPSTDFAMGMNTVDVRDMVRLTRHLVRVAVDTLTRTREEMGA